LTTTRVAALEDPPKLGIAVRRRERLGERRSFGGRHAESLEALVQLIFARQRRRTLRRAGGLERVEPRCVLGAEREPLAD